MSQFCWRGEERRERCRQARLGQTSRLVVTGGVCWCLLVPEAGVGMSGMFLTTGGARAAPCRSHILSSHPARLLSSGGMFRPDNQPPSSSLITDN